MTSNATPLDWEPETEEDYETARLYLKEHFAAWCSANGTVIEAEAGEAPTHYKFHYVGGHLTRWSTEDLDEIYLELHPAKVIIEDEELDAVLAEAAAFMTFLAETELLDPRSDDAGALVEHLGRIKGRFRANMGDERRYSPGKRITMAALAEGVDLGDQGALESFMMAFNSRPRSERDAIFGRSAPPVSSSGRVTAPGTRPRPKQPARRRKRR